MKILFIAKRRYPNIGGVERHIERIANRLQVTGNTITTISGEDIKYPKIKIIGLLYIWYWLFKNRGLITGCNLVHIHDVFIWYLPFRFLFPTKKVFITFHGWEGKFPPTLWSIINKKVANYLCNGSIAVGKYIEKWYGVKTDAIMYGAVEKLNVKNANAKLPNTIVWLGRLEKDTGILDFLRYISSLVYGYKVTFVGDGSLRKMCQKFGKVTGNIKNPEKYLKNAEYCVPSGYLSYLEAKNMGCKILTFANNPLKEDYWKEVKLLKTIPTWDEVCGIYRKLWEK